MPYGNMIRIRLILSNENKYNEFSFYVKFQEWTEWLIHLPVISPFTFFAFSSTVITKHIPDSANLLEFRMFSNEMLIIWWWEKEQQQMKKKILDNWVCVSMFLIWLGMSDMSVAGAVVAALSTKTNTFSISRFGRKHLWHKFIWICSCVHSMELFGTIFIIIWVHIFIIVHLEHNFTRNERHFHRTFGIWLARTHTQSLFAFLHFNYIFIFIVRL